MPIDAAAEAIEQPAKLPVLPTRQPLRPFYITGLPKSRTAWLSVAFSDYRLTACLHEPLARMAAFTAEALTAVLGASHTPFAGISDSGLAIVAPDLPAALPGPMVVVLRDADDVAESLVRYLGGSIEAHTGGVALMLERLHAMIDRYHPMLVDFYDLGRNDVMRAIWAHLLPGTTFQRRRIESLQHMMIEPVVEHLLAGLTDQARQAAERAMGVTADAAGVVIP